MNIRPGDLWTLIERKKQLEQFIRKAEERLKNAPEGAVRIIKHGKGYQFFYRREPREKSGIYIPAHNFEKARALIQKKYDEKILVASRTQLALLDRFLQQYDPDILKRIYEQSGEVRQGFIRAVELPDKEFRANWRAVEYMGKDFREGAAEHYTLKGERVRSKSEVMIANALFQADLDYRYEYPVMLGNQIVYSDFTVLRMPDRKEIRWEHAGLIDDVDYRNEFLGKLNLYEENGYFIGENLIVTMETQKRPLNIRDVQRTIRHHFFQEDR